MKFDKSNIEAIYPLSPMQQGMLFHSLLDPDSGVYVEQLQCTFRGALDVPAFERAWQRLVDAHAVLRTGFFSERLERPLQIVSRALFLSIDIRDWRGLAVEEQGRRWEVLLADDRRRGFDLTAAPLMRLALIRTAEDGYRFVWSHHHILLDGWSLPLLLPQVFAYYAAFSAGETLRLESPRPYRDYIAWLQGQDVAKAEGHWRERLAGFGAPTPLGVDRVLDSQPAGYAEETWELSSQSTAALQALAQRQQLTLNTLFQGAWAVLLSRYSGTQDVVFGVTVSGRPAALHGVEEMVGLFINTLPVRVEVTPEAALSDWLQALQAQNVASLEYQYAPLAEVQRWSDVPGGVPLFESIVVFENYPVDAALGKQGIEGLEIHDVRAHEQTNYALTLAVAPGASLSLGLNYDQQRFDASTITRLLGHLCTLLEGMAANAEGRLSELPLLTTAEREQLLVAWNATETAYPQDRCIHQLFEGQVEKSPEATAVVFEDQSLTYRELNARANQLAHHLRTLGVGPDVLVGICLERSLEMVVGLLGILKAGGAYVPLDADYPQERLAFILEDTQARVLVTQAAVLETLPASRATGVCLDRDWRTFSHGNPQNPVNHTQPEHLAYIIYTSGSSGRPKGVAIQQASLVNHTQDVVDDYDLAPEDRALQFASTSFDVSAEEIYPTLVRGATLVLRASAAIDSTQAFTRYCGEQSISVLNLPTAYWHQWTQGWEDGYELPAAIRLVIIGGERALRAPLIAWHARFGDRIRLVNAYGPTEGTITATRCAVVSERLPGQEVAIGRPIANTQAYVLDDELHPVPVGVPGELHIGGTGLARGYLNRLDLTAEKFIPNPFSATPGERLYKTGDLARYLPDGNIEFLGRIDHQVKVRGFRIELGEIEATLAQHPAVREAVVVAREAGPGEKRLVAYVVATPDTELEVNALRGFLKEKLPEYMVPSAFVFLDALPLTPNGKVDRKALPAPDGRVERSQAYVAPRTPTEERLAGIWAELLGVERVGVHDNFFELGGHSLLATQVVSRIRDAFETELALRALFEAPTLAGLAQAIETARLAGGGLEAPPIKPISREGELPLSFAQQRLWFLDRLEPDSPFYNIPAAVRLQGVLDGAALAGSFNAILERHEALRTTFSTLDGEAVQVIAPALKLALPVIDLAPLPASEREARARALTTEEAKRPFDLAQGPLVRAQLLRLAEHDHLLQVTLHHVVADGWSVGVLVDELAALYRALLAGEPSPLPPLPIQYADFAHWQRAWLQGEVLEKQLVYWKAQLKDLPPRLELPTDRPRPAVQTYHGAHHPIAVSPELTRALRALSREAGTTLFMSLLAALQVLLSRYTGQHDVAVGSPIANRNRAETEGLIGFFVNTLVLRAELSENASFRELLARTKDTTLGAYAHQDLPFERLVDALQPERDMSHTPLFQVMFVLQNAPLRPLRLAGLALTPWALEPGTAKFDLSLDLAEEGEGLAGALEYNTDLFDASTMARLAGHFITLLEGIVQAPERRVSELPLLTTAEREQLLVAWNATETAYPQDRCIHQLFEGQVEKSPEATAVVFEDQSLTYRELNARANQLAHHLRSLGVGPDVLVGICLERSLEMVVGLLGILKAGGAYVPLDPDYPQARLAFMLEDTQARVLVTEEPLLQALPATPADVVCLDRDWPRIGHRNNSNPTHHTQPEHLAYVIYTSGSTGKPKGVQLHHRGLCNMVTAQVKAFGTSSRVLQFAAFSFDASVSECFMALIAGATLYLARSEQLLPGTDLLQLLRDQSISVATLPPSVLNVLADDALEALRTLIVAGERCSSDLVRRWASGRHFFNAYGPTESTVCATLTQCKDSDTAPPIGRPIANTQVYVLDEELNPVPLGAPGELHIAGTGLARCYLNRPELTAEKFIANPFSDTPGARLYKTGDLARYLPDGNIEFLGRIDHQVKIRGFRIELGEIEATLGQHTAVREAVVVAREEGPGDKRLVAYVVATPDTELEVNALRGFLKEKLPEYMVPAAFVFLDALPLTPNGKVDRKALPAPDGRVERSQAYVAPRTPTEERLAGIWAELLGVERVGVHDNFFELGGHSLLATQVVSRIRDAFETELALRALFEAPTVAGVAQAIDQTRQEGVVARKTVIDFNAEALLDHTIQPPSVPAKTLGNPDSILLTGATGFLGAYLLYELLLQTKADIYCLVRSSSVDEGKERLKSKLDSYSLWNDKFNSRIIPLAGELSQPLFGLSESLFHQLARQIDVIYHSGAMVNFVYPYSEMKATNVLGTQEALRLASQIKAKSFHFVSTISVLSFSGDSGVRVVRESDTGDIQGLDDGYSQSKWVAEKLVMQARDRGLPVCIYRPSRITGHSQTGVASVDDFLNRGIKGCIQLGMFPPVDNIEDNMVPVDYVSRAIVYLSQQPPSLRKTFHLVNPRSNSWVDIFDLLRSLGYPLRQTSYVQWRTELNCQEENALHPLMPLFPEERSQEESISEPQFDCQNTIEGLAGTNIACLPVDTKLLKIYLSYLRNSGFLEAPTIAHSGAPPLSEATDI